MLRSKYLPTVVSIFILFPVFVLAQILSPVVITTTSLPDAALGVSVSDPVFASGGVAPYTWSATGLPSGVSIDSSTGIISGVPVLGEFSSPIPQLMTVYTPSIHIQDAVGQIADVTLTWNLSSSFLYTRTPSGSGPFASPVTLNIHGIMGDDFCPGSSGYTLNLATSPNSPGGVQWSFGHNIGDIVDDNLIVPPGTYYRVTFPNCGRAGLTAILESGNPVFSVASVPSITSNSLLPFEITGMPVSISLQVNSGVSPYFWSVINGMLPDGLLLDTTTGIISGTSTVATSSVFTVQVQDALGQNSAVTFTLHVTEPVTPIFITTSSLPDSAFGTSISDPITATGGVPPFIWSATGLPSGVSIDPSTGVISGSPKLDRFGVPVPSPVTTYTSGIHVQDSVGQVADRALTWNISSSFSYTRTPPGNGLFANLLSFHIHGIMGIDFCPNRDSYTIQITNNLFFPGGPRQNFSHNIGDVVDDTWIASLPPGDYTIVRLPNCGEAGLTATLETGNPLFSIASNPSITTNPLLTPSVVDHPYSTTLQYSLSTNGFNQSVVANPYTWSVTSGTLPAGLSLDTSTGAISGTPTVVGTSTFTVRVQDSVGQSSSVVFTMVVFSPVIITNAFLPSATDGISYSQLLIATTTGLSTFSWIITAGTLPGGLTLGLSTGIIAGIPNTPGVYNFTVQATDVNGHTATRQLSIVVNPVPVVTTATLSEATVNTPYSQLIGVSGGTVPLSWSIVSGTLPTNLALNSSTGEIVGTPTANGTWSFTVSVRDINGATTSQAFSIKVNKVTIITTNDTNHLNGKVGTTYSVTLKANGGTDPDTWSVISGSLPSGLTLNSITGVITGTPTTMGTYTFTVQVTDLNGNVDTKVLTPQIKP